MPAKGSLKDIAETEVNSEEIKINNDDEMDKTPKIVKK